ncbi:hypothetical protein PAXINDRAFT_30823, partial [Paxillus involutus ATCC 200175]
LFEAIKRSQGEEGLDPWGPFADGEEWKLVKWLVRHIGHTAIEEFTKLPTAIDKLPQSSEWKLKGVTIEGDSLGAD